MRGAEIGGIVLHLGEHRGGDAKDPHQVRVPLLAADVEQQGARGVGDVGRERACEARDQERVDRPERDLAGLGPCPQALHVVEDPGELGAGEVRVEDEARLLGHQRLQPLGLQRGAAFGGAAVLPDDGVVHRPSGGPFPNRRRLALVGDADGGHLVRFEPGFAQRPLHRCDGGVPDVLEIVLHPARARVMLRELLLADAEDGLVRAEHDGSGRGGALIDGEDGGGHFIFFSFGFRNRPPRAALEAHQFRLDCQTAVMRWRHLTSSNGALLVTIRHIVFDIGRVLLVWEPELPYRRLIPDEAERRWFLETVCTSSWNVEQDRGRSWADGEAVLIEAWPQHEALIRAFRANWHEMVPSLLPETPEIFEALIANGHDVTMLTNFAADTFAAAQERFPVLTRSRGVTVSGSVGLVKPDPAIFAHHAATFGLDPAATLFFDDSAPNVEAATAAGWTARLHTSPEQMRADLRALEIAEFAG